MRFSRRFPGPLSFSIMVLAIFVLSAHSLAGNQKVVVANDCPITLWIHFTGNPAPDGGITHKMLPMDTLVFDNWPDFGAGRCWAYYHDPGTKTNPSAPILPENGFVEMTVSGGSTGVQNYNISYVDYATLPVKVVGGCSSCIPTIVPVTFKEMQGQLKHGCPTQLNYYDSTLGIGICLGSYNYCVQPGYDTGNIYCNKMWLGHHHHGTEVYGGSLNPGSSDKLFDSIAAWQRGTFYQDADSSHYWKKPEQDSLGNWVNPYNLFAKWVHKTLGAQVYAFANDDHQNQSGFQACPNSCGYGELQITWCPCEGPGGCKEDPLTAVKEEKYSPVMRMQDEKFIRYILFTPDGRTIRSGIATSMDEASRSISNKLSLSRGVYFIALYNKEGGLAASKKLFATW
ncbi:MAG TPA: hypothetical protein VLX68_10830 [Chitinivibrionales bacterium]|nr:hypothetical protein [Chitinivibrionales bacterium]